jgi:beta-lactamase superfamily II metal-dependent hydrolase
VGKVYLPYVYQDVVQGVFPELERVEQLISTKNIDFEYNTFLHTVKGDGYHFTFLSPEENSMPNGVYSNFDPLSPNESQINDISSVIYLDCLGVRFMFMGDVSKSVERKIVDRYIGTTIYQQYANSKGYNLELEDIDFLKVAHHGASQSTSVELVNLLTPKNAVISVGALNQFGHPSTEALSTLLENGDGINVLRTDVKGNVVVAIQRDGSYQITTKIC